MISEIANEIARIKRDLARKVLVSEQALSRLYRLAATPIPYWMIDQGLRVEVNAEDWMEWTLYDRHDVNEIMGVRVYPQHPRYGIIPAPGWRVINPFERPRDQDPMFKALDQVMKEKAP